MAQMTQVLGPLTPMIDVVDVGAMWLGESVVPYRSLVQSGVARVVGFEPAPGECEKLNALGLINQTYLPYFVGDGTRRKFYLTNHSMTSSLYEPNTRLLKRFLELEEVTRTVQVLDVQTQRLDDMPEITNIDLLKIDVQGAELDVIKGGPRCIREALVVQAEVEFVQMYKGQPLFSDVDVAMRELGFLMHMFPGTALGAFRPLIEQAVQPRHMRQLMWADAVYVRHFDTFPELSPEDLLKLAMILHEVYTSIDLAALALANYDAKMKSDLWGKYMAAIAPGKKLARPEIL